MKKSKRIAFVLIVLAGSFMIESSNTVQAADRVQISKKNFPDEEIRRSATEADENEDYGNKDGYLSVKEAKTVKNIDILYHNDWYEEGVELDEDKEPYIANLKGIQYFKELEELYISVVDYSSSKTPKILNLEKIKNLKKLKYLTYNGDSGKDKIDFSGNKSLESIMISEDPFKDIKLDNSKLKELYIDGSRIKTLDLRKAKKLEVVHCEYGRLKKIKVSSRNIIRYVNLYSNKIKTLDGSIFNKKTIRRVNIGENPIKKFNVSKLKKLLKISHSKKTKVIKGKNQVKLEVETYK